MKSSINTVSVCYINLRHIYFSRPGRSVLPFHSTGTVERTMLKLMINENKFIILVFLRLPNEDFFTSSGWLIFFPKNYNRLTFVPIYHLLKFAQYRNCSFQDSRKGSGRCSNNCIFFDKIETWTKFHFPSYKLSLP